MLYVVPGPVGNLADITRRALEILEKVDYILCEDSRVSGRLLEHYEIKNRLRSYHAHNEHRLTDEIVQELREGREIALISDAGTPGISDPGFLLIRELQKEGLPFTVLPGPSSIIPAIVGSGLPSDKFCFEGFLPHKKGRQGRIEYIAGLPGTAVLFESPYRLLKILKELADACGGDRMACVAREISKLHEEFRTAPLQELLEHYSSLPKVRGEIVIVLASGDYQGSE